MTDAVQDYLCAMDVFVLSSLHEGLPVVGVEAQTNGLPCFFSSEITTEINISETGQFLFLQCPPENWADVEKKGDPVKSHISI